MFYILEFPPISIHVKRIRGRRHCVILSSGGPAQHAGAGARHDYFLGPYFVRGLDFVRPPLLRSHVGFNLLLSGRGLSSANLAAGGFCGAVS